MQASESGLGLKTIRNDDVTDNNGLVTFLGDGIASVGATIQKKGYYDSGSGYEFSTESKLLNRWEPWNPTVEVILKKKRNPIPMLAKNTDWMEVPKIGTPIGYDLEKGDWVAPYGIGVTSDLLIDFHLIKRAYLDYEADMTISFSNLKDGIQEYYFDEQEQSYFKWPFKAPEDGYVHSVNLFEIDTPSKGYKTNKRKNVNYIFRVRTKLDKEGNITAAKYGKLSGEFGISRKGKTRFTYYFNPSGTKNLEFDPDKNLFSWTQKQWQHMVNSP